MKTGNSIALRQRVFSRSEPHSSDNFWHGIDGGDPQEPLIVTRAQAEERKVWPEERTRSRAPHQPGGRAGLAELWKSLTTSGFCKHVTKRGEGGQGMGKCVLGRLGFISGGVLAFFFLFASFAIPRYQRKSMNFSYSVSHSGGSPPNPISTFHHTGIATFA